VLQPDAFQALSEEERARITKVIEELQKRLKDALSAIPRWMQENRRASGRSTTRPRPWPWATSSPACARPTATSRRSWPISTRSRPMCAAISGLSRAMPRRRTRHALGEHRGAAAALSPLQGQISWSDRSDATARP
jgi:hypothetical protein